MKKSLENLIKKTLTAASGNSYSYNHYPLLENAFVHDDILAAIEVLLSKKITMSEVTNSFEYEFGKYIGSKYTLMTNSGSSANLLAAFTLVNPKKKFFLKPGDYFAIPAVCWSTSLWPFVQSGLKPIFIDVNINNFSLDEEKLDKNLLKKIRLIVDIHVLGNCSNIEMISNLAKKNNIFLFEDTCESLGSVYNSKYLGTFGDFASYSFYYSHQVTAGEGGMLICKNKEDYEIAYTLRAHGWDRGLKKNTKKSFNFINSGFNLRPLDITAAIGLSQFKRLNKMMSVRKENRDLIISSIENHKNYKNQFIFFKENKNLKASWFGLPILLRPDLKNKKNKFLKYLNLNKIETRPIISGNFLNQPAAKLYNYTNKNMKKYFPVSQDIEERGFFIGLPTNKIHNNQLNHLVDKLVNFNEFKVNCPII
jgi:CDP-6-deoxy-D-xylo-4-hexulose-3-dehydrase